MLLSELLFEAVQSFEDWQKREINRLGDKYNPEEYDHRFQHVHDWYLARMNDLTKLQNYTFDRAEQKAREWIEIGKQNRKSEAPIEEKEYDIIYESDKWKVIKPKTVKAATKWSSDTSWCTAYEGTCKSYFDQGPLYVIVSKKKKTKDKDGKVIPVKYQFHLQSKQFMNMSDRPVDPASKELKDATEAILLHDSSSAALTTAMEKVPSVLHKLLPGFLAKNEPTRQILLSLVKGNSTAGLQMIIDDGRLDVAANNNEAVKYALGHRHKAVAKLLLSQESVRNTLPPDKLTSYEEMAK